MSNSCSLEILDGICRKASAVRSRVDLSPVGGEAGKVFPPTYKGPGKEGSVYCTELRLVNGEDVPTVLLDSVQSQANRFEAALLEAMESGELVFPIVKCKIPGRGVLTTLELPHRIYDAVLRDSELDGTAFLETDVGIRLGQATTKWATPLFEVNPSSLIFGAWDSHTAKKGRAAKFRRVIASEIIGWKMLEGMRQATKIDPLGVRRSVPIFKAGQGGFTFEENEASTDKRGKAIPTKASEVGYGVHPASSGRGGVTVERATQEMVISIPALRQLHFGEEVGDRSPERDVAGWRVLLALALVGVVMQREEGYDLRSGCSLVAIREPSYEIVGRTLDDIQPFALNKEQALELFAESVVAAKEQGLELNESISLDASQKLAELVRRSDEEASGGEEE